MKDKNTSFRSAMGRVRGLGSAKDGTGHWWAMKLTALALIPLVIWFILALFGLIGAEQADVQAWLKQPMNALFMLLFVGFGLHHSAYGVQAVVEDYVHAHAAKITILIINSFAHLAAAVAAAYAIIIIALKV